MKAQEIKRIDEIGANSPQANIFGECHGIVTLGNEDYDECVELISKHALKTVATDNTLTTACIERAKELNFYNVEDKRWSQDL